jgi:hypothetical protein
VALDPRLADLQFLTIAAMRAKQRQVTAPPRLVSVRVVYYDALGIEPDELGERYTYTLPPHDAGGGA